MNLYYVAAQKTDAYVEHTAHAQFSSSRVAIISYRGLCKLGSYTVLQAVYFVKRRHEIIKKDNFHDLVMFGDLSHVPLDHFTAFIDSVSLPTFAIL